MAGESIVIKIKEEEQAEHTYRKDFYIKMLYIKLL